jgi:hypothetical protein
VLLLAVVVEKQQADNTFDTHSWLVAYTFLALIADTADTADTDCWYHTDFAIHTAGDHVPWYIRPFQATPHCRVTRHIP